MPCSNTCEYRNDGACDDGGEGASYAQCELATDCTDCGVRLVNGTVTWELEAALFPEDWAEAFGCTTRHGLEVP